MNEIIIKNYIKAEFGGINGYIFTAKVKDILPIYYVAVRGKDDIPGAVQRVLNKHRISSIKDFILAGNMFMNTFILNWTNSNKINITDDFIKIPSVNFAAQVIDGQHRLEGLKKAFEEDKSIGEKKIVVILVENLTTEDAAKIFLNINTEQKPVPQSLVYDLFGIVNSKDTAISRATDIANLLHTDRESPYYQCIKLPGSSQGVGKVDLSTVVNALKPFISQEGIFYKYNLMDLETQYKIIFNFFDSLKYFYEKEGLWLINKNPFMSNAGFFAGTKFLCTDLIGKCVEKKSFEKKVITELLDLDNVGLLYREDIKNKQGKEQRSTIYQYLQDSLLREVPSQNEYKF